MRKMPKPMVPLIDLNNVDGHKPDVATTILSYLLAKPLIALLSILFKSDLPESDHKKIDEEPVHEFLWQCICCNTGINNFLPEPAKFCKYTYKVILCMIITNKKHSGPDIKPDTAIEGTGIKDIMFTA